MSHYVMTGWLDHKFLLYGNAVSCADMMIGNNPCTRNEDSLPGCVWSLAANDIGFAAAPDRQAGIQGNAMIDDVRVFNTTLAQKDITALYDLGLAGR